MTRSIEDSLKHRRSYYQLSGKSPVSDKEIEKVLDFAATYVPSAFNSQSTRMVLLLGDNHKRFWNIVKDVLKKRLSAEAFVKTGSKIDESFASGYGTVLYYEDQSVVEGLQEKFPSYSENFPVWSQQTSAMHQLVVWTMLEDMGFGASLQHYNPIIDEDVRKEWDIPAKWKLVAQMPFGLPAGEPDQKVMNPVGSRVVVFK